MNINTILVHVADDDACKHRLTLAKTLARKHSAHVSALFIPNPHHRASIGRGASSVLMAEFLEGARKRAEDVREEFERISSEWGVSHSWHEEEGDHLEILEDHARAADLMIVSQSEVERFEDRFRKLFAEELVLRSGVPILVVPRDHDSLEVGNKVLIAWQSSRECVRAVRDSLALLEAASSVTVLSIGDAVGSGHLAPDQVINYLARHGVSAQLRQEQRDAANVGEQILDVVKEDGFDLLVMGAYSSGTAPFALFLGTATKAISRGMTVPTIMSH